MKHLIGSVLKKCEKLTLIKNGMVYLVAIYRRVLACWRYGSVSALLARESEYISMLAILKEQSINLIKEGSV